LAGLKTVFGQRGRILLRAVPSQPAVMDLVDALLLERLPQATQAKGMCYSIVWGFVGDLILPVQVRGTHRFLQDSKLVTFKPGQGYVGRILAQSKSKGTSGMPYEVLSDIVAVDPRRFLRKQSALINGILSLSFMPQDDGSVLEIGFDRPNDAYEFAAKMLLSKMIVTSSSFPSPSSRSKSKAVADFGSMLPDIDCAQGSPTPSDSGQDSQTASETATELLTPRQTCSADTDAQTKTGSELPDMYFDQGCQTPSEISTTESPPISVKDDEDDDDLPWKLPLTRIPRFDDDDAAGLEFPRTRTPSPVRSICSSWWPSEGSQGHPHCCRPACKFHWRPKGCKDGANCTRCHICRYTRSDARVKVMRQSPDSVDYSQMQ